MSDIRQFLETRRRQVDTELKKLFAERNEIQGKIDGLEREQNELDRAAKAIGMVNGLSSLRVTRKAPTGMTIKQAVLQVLQDHPSGLIALDILREVNSRYEMAIVRSSLSPQLSRLKGESKISNDGNVWLLSPASSSERSPEKSGGGHP